jgi:hypothetical protein
LNSILVYLLANLTAKRPITKLARETTTKNVQTKYKIRNVYNNNNNNNETRKMEVIITCEESKISKFAMVMLLYGEKG